jgi:serine/threonine protein kinase
MAEILRDHFKNKFLLPSSTLPYFLIWIFGPLMGFTHSYIEKNIDHSIKFDNSYTIKDLGLKFTDVKTAVWDNLIHGDVQPENIILRGGKPEAVLIDFDLSLDFDHELTTRRAEENAPGFASPELYITGTKPTQASDIYSLAATLYVLLTGQIPVDALKRKLDNIHLQEPKEINPKISDRINQAILTGMKLNPQERSQSVKKWLDSLGGTEKKPKPIFDWSWDKNIQFWTLVIAGIAAIGTLLSGIVGWIPIFKPSPPTSTPSLSPTSLPTNKP